MPNLALFDLDNTLLLGDSESEWGKYLIKIGIRDEKDYSSRHAIFCHQYDRGELDVEALIRFQLEILTAYPATQLLEWRQAYIEECIVALLAEAGKEAIKMHQSQGDQVIIITATNAFLTRPIADLLGVKELIASELEQDMDGNYTGRTVGQLSYREGKISRLHQWCHAKGHRLDDYEKIWFYTDSHNDLPLLKLATHPIAIDPDPPLRQYANDQGWNILTWRTF